MHRQAADSPSTTPAVPAGQGLALLEGVLALATIAQSFELIPVPGQTVVPVPGVTLRPRDGVRLRLRRRVPGPT